MELNQIEQDLYKKMIGEKDQAVLSGHIVEVKNKLNAEYWKPIYDSFSNIPGIKNRNDLRTIKAGTYNLANGYKLVKGLTPAPTGPSGGSRWSTYSLIDPEGNAGDPIKYTGGYSSLQRDLQSQLANSLGVNPILLRSGESIFKAVPDYVQYLNEKGADLNQAIERQAPGTGVQSMESVPDFSIASLGKDQVGSTAVGLWQKDGKTIDPAKYANFETDEELKNWAYSQGYSPISGSGGTAAQTDENLRLLGPTEYEGLNKDWRAAGLTKEQVESNFIVKKYNPESGQDDIYLKTDAPASEDITAASGRRYIGTTEWEELQGTWKEQGLTPAEIESNLIEREDGNIFLKAATQQEEAFDDELGELATSTYKPGEDTIKSIIDGRQPEETEIPLATPAEDLDLGSLTAPKLYDVPDPVANFNSEAEGLTGMITAKKTALTDLYDKQIAEADKKSGILKTSIEGMEVKKEGIIEGDLKDAYEPFREDKEKSERDRLKIEENYFANQGSIQQLEDLLNTAMADIKAAESTTGLSSIRIPRINAIKSDWQGRVGVIEAVMAARNNQIAVGNNLIDRTVNAIAGDKQDMVNYYTSLYNYYDSIQGKKEAELLGIDQKKMDALNSKIALEIADINDLTATKNYVQELMLNPSTANLLEMAGVSLTDSVSTINKKLGQAQYIQEGIGIRNHFEELGLQHITNNSQFAGLAADRVVTQYDSRGKAYQFIIPEDSETVPTNFITDPMGNFMLVNSQTGEVIKNFGSTPSSDETAYGDRETQIITASGRSMLVDKQTGEVLQDFGSAYKTSTGGSGGASSTDSTARQQYDQYIKGGSSPNDAAAKVKEETGYTVEMTDWDWVRQLAVDNPDASYADLEASAREKTKMSDSDIKVLLGQLGKKAGDGNDDDSDEKLKAAAESLDKSWWEFWK